MQVKQLNHIFTNYLNRNNVSYQLYTENWFMEIKVKLQTTSLRFSVQQRDTTTDGLKYDLFVLEPSGFNKLGSDINFDPLEGNNLITHISEYLKKLSVFFNQDSQRILVKETLVTDSEHKQVYYDDFLGVLHAAGFIETDYVETQKGDAKLVRVFIE